MRPGVPTPLFFRLSATIHTKMWRGYRFDFLLYLIRCCAVNHYSDQLNQVKHMNIWYITIRVPMSKFSLGEKLSIKREMTRLHWCGCTAVVSGTGALNKGIIYCQLSLQTNMVYVVSPYDVFLVLFCFSTCLCSTE